MALSRKIRAGDILRIGDTLIKCLNGSGLRVLIEAPSHIKIDHKPRKALTRHGLPRKTRG